MVGGKFIWSNNQYPPTLERLDRCLITKDWENMSPMVFIQKLPRDLSDHNPLIVSSAITPQLRNFSFKFETSWLKHREFLDKVRDVWARPCRAESALDKIQIKLKRFKQYFKGWGFNIQGQQKKRKNDIHTELLALEVIEEEPDLSLDQIQKMVSMKSELMQILGVEKV